MWKVNGCCLHQITFGHRQSLHFYCRLLHSGGSPTAFPIVLKSCAALSLPASGSQLHALSVRVGCEPDPFVQTALITIYCRCGSVENACKVFDESPQSKMLTVDHRFDCWVRCFFERGNWMCGLTRLRCWVWFLVLRILCIWVLGGVFMGLL
ncbi:mitochondrial editing factor 19 [Actinidia rufa]|uniref:Mitochondrial editing factor 19 n=1 Tax=Actinidia rufa TaxID=165716 RepID=A0A7J0DQI1_9ERIC|nr:mitochondrial editing factor 19 [Actinidia rufa]